MAKDFIEVDSKGLEKVQKAMKEYPQDARAAMANALNRTASKTVSFTHEAVTDKYTAKRKSVKSTMNIKKARRNNLEAVVTSTDKRIKVSGFKYGKTGTNRIARPEIIRGQRKTSTSNPPLFVGRANKSHGKQEVFVRTPGERFPISYGFSIGIPQMIQNNEVWKKVGKQAGEFLQQRFAHEFEQRLIRTNAKYSDKG